MIILMKCLDEEFVVRRCISDFYDEEFVSQIIVVDGKSTDFTVQELKQFPKVSTFIHEWIRSYHYQEVIQSQICLSYVPNGEIFFILDFDERMSDKLKETLSKIDKGEIYIPDETIVNFPRRTLDILRYENSPHAIIGDDGWPIISHQIGQYPDPQCRLMRKFPSFHWINSPHHVPCGHKSEIVLEGDILHFNRDDLRCRERTEKQWAFAQARRKELGLTADRFETKIKIEIAEAFEPEYWKGKK